MSGLTEETSISLLDTMMSAFMNNVTMRTFVLNMAKAWEEIIVKILGKSKDIFQLGFFLRYPH